MRRKLSIAAVNKGKVLAYLLQTKISANGLYWYPFSIGFYCKFSALEVKSKIFTILPVKTFRSALFLGYLLYLHCCNFAQKVRKITQITPRFVWNHVNFTLFNPFQTTNANMWLNTGKGILVGEIVICSKSNTLSLRHLLKAKHVRYMGIEHNPYIIA